MKHKPRPKYYAMNARNRGNLHRLTLVRTLTSWQRKAGGSARMKRAAFVRLTVNLRENYFRGNNRRMY